MKNRVLQYDFESLPATPFTVYFLEKGEVQPKMMFTVTGKFINREKEKVELFINELARTVEYHPDLVKRVEMFMVN